MTLFIKTPKRIFEIIDVYIMALTFLISFGVTKIFKGVIEKQKLRNSKNVKMSNPTGGSTNIEFEFSDDTEMAHTILACIA